LSLPRILCTPETLPSSRHVSRRRPADRKGPRELPTGYTAVPHSRVRARQLLDVRASESRQDRRLRDPEWRCPTWGYGCWFSDPWRAVLPLHRLLPNAPPATVCRSSTGGLPSIRERGSVTGAIAAFLQRPKGQDTAGDAGTTSALGVLLPQLPLPLHRRLGSCLVLG